jgi:uncharacterized protein
MQKLFSLLLGVCLTLLCGCTGLQRNLLFYPTHHNGDNGLAAWKQNEKIIGYSREVPTPENIWLMLHGNAGQATDRIYAIPSFSQHDSVFILEYPGYGARGNKPSKATFDAAATEAYQFLRKTFPNTPVCVVGESIGTGPACTLATQSQPPDKIVLIVPFDNLASVASEHVSFLPVSLILEAKWDNARALSTYKGPVEIFAAQQDTVIPIDHARKLANAIPSAQFHCIYGGHNDWSRTGQVAIRNP